ncbi:MAG: gamma-glutamyl-gamma-aminobutyrate hydrolase family protein [Chloroflexi bacterium]|nr:gamma-glutamyl-gamma-aminobutyrate hydrolase family protein [Chloroflexota bacterium]
MKMLIWVTAARMEKGGRTIHYLGQAYAQAILRAGGIPLLIPADTPEADYEDLHSRLDGLLLTGGGDVDPGRFNGKPHPRVGEVDDARDRLEVGLVQLAAQTDWPFLAICRGVQVMNVALGGTLYTDITDQFAGAVRHDYYPDWPRDYLAHEVQVVNSSHLGQVLGTGRLQVNSLHHQGVAQIAPALRPAAYATDRLVEALELPQHCFGVGVQWHPEELPESPANQALFRDFVEACRAD